MDYGMYVFFTWLLAVLVHTWYEKPIARCISQKRCCRGTEEFGVVKRLAQRCNRPEQDPAGAPHTNIP